MALIDYLIPIVQGKNNSVSVEGESRHPNAALLSNYYNSAIQEIIDLFVLFEATLNQKISNLNNFTTDNLNEGTDNKYYSTTQAQADAKTAISILAGNSGITYENGVFNFSNIVAGITNLSNFTTDNLNEGTDNKYYSTTQAQADARNAISVASGGSLDPATGILTITAVGNDGVGISSSSYNFSTGKLRLDFDDGSFIETGDLRGGLSPKGIWNSTVQYEILDAVTYDGNAYLAKLSNINADPSTNPDKWELWLQKGIKGDPGNPGKSAFELWLLDNPGRTYEEYLSTYIPTVLTQAEYDALVNPYSEALYFIS